MLLPTTLLVAVSVLVLLLGSRPMAAQTRGSGTAPSGSSSGALNPDMTAIANIILTGNVLTAEGVPPSEPVAIEKICGGQTARLGYTDTRGFFSIRLTDSLPALQDASENGAGDLSTGGVLPSSATGFGMQPTELPSGSVNGLGAVAGCELRGLLAGFQSTSLMIIASNSLQAVNLGTIILVSGQEQGSTVSSTSLSAPKEARKAYEKANVNLQKRKPVEAQAHLEHAVAVYPKYAIAWTQLGRLYEQQNQLNEAKAAFSQAQAADDKFVPAYVGLASVAIRQSKWSEAEPLSARATQLDAVDFPVAYYYNAAANFELGDLEKAEKSAHMTERLDTRHALPQAKLLLAAILARKRDYHGAAEELKLYLKSAPAADAPKIREQIASLERIAASPQPAPVPQPVSRVASSPAPALEARVVAPPTQEDMIKAANSTSLVAPIREDWAPPDIDHVIPPVRPNVPCSMPTVLAAVSMRVKELMDNLQQFTATERIEHMKVDKEGDSQHTETATFKYVAQIRQGKHGELEAEEYRDGSTSQTFPAKLVTTGLVAHALMFHPSIVDDLEVTCEGLGSVRGKPAWQLHFAQRKDRPPRFREYRTQKGAFRVEMKGRAWVAADSYQVMRMETDLARPIEEIALSKDHVVIDYRPVEFRKRHVRLWLPESADLYVDLNGQRLHRRHSLSDFELFSVDTEEKRKEPVDPGPVG